MPCDSISRNAYIGGKCIGSSRRSHSGSLPRNSALLSKLICGFFFAPEAMSICSDAEPATAVTCVGRSAARTDSIPEVPATSRGGFQTDTTTARLCGMIDKRLPGTDLDSSFAREKKGLRSSGTSWKRWSGGTGRNATDQTDRVSRTEREEQPNVPVVPADCRFYDLPFPTGNPPLPTGLGHRAVADRHRFGGVCRLFLCF